MVDNITSLLYSLMRDHVQPGIMEFLVREIETHPRDVIYSNKHLANYAMELSERLKIV